MNLSYKKSLGILLESVLVYLALFIDMSSVFPNIYAQAVATGITIKVVTFFQRLDGLWGEYSFWKGMACLIIVCTLYFLHAKSKKVYPSFIKYISGVFAILYVFSESFMNTNSADYVLGDAFVFIISMLRVCGFYILINYILKACYYVIEKLANYSCEDIKKYSFLKILCVIVIAWIPQLIIIYPGGYCNDVQNQLMQFFGYIPMSDPHPPAFTAIIGMCVWIGNLLHSPNVGLYLYILLQFLFMAVGMTYCICFLWKRGCNKFFIYASAGFVAVLPIFSHYASVVIKDAPYAVCLLLMSVSAYELLETEWVDEDKRKRVFGMLRFSLWGLLAALLKHNGIYIAIPMVVLLVFFIIRKQIKLKEKAIAITLLSVGIIGFFFVTKCIYPMCGIEKGMDHLLYTNMLQHSCRLIIEHPEELTDEDVAVISQVIDYERIPEYYNPLTSDGIKPIVDLEADDEVVAEYIKVWLKQVKKHPFVVLEASFNVSYGFFSPIARNEENDFSTWFYESEYEELNFSVPSILRTLRYIYESALEFYVSLPIINLLENPGLYFWLFVFCFCFIMNMKEKRYLICFVPGVMTAVFYVGIPAYYHHPRYAFPLMYSAIFYVGMCILMMRVNKGENSEKQE